MKDRIRLALEATHRLRRSPGYTGLQTAERLALDRDLARIEAALGNDPYATGLADAVPPPDATGGGPPAEKPPAAPPPPPGTAQIGTRAAAALEAVNFAGFVAGLVTGTFQAIVDATSQQIREYANLVASLSKSLDDFSRENVTDGQARGWLAGRYPQDLTQTVPAPGQAGTPQLVPRESQAGASPAWLGQYGLEGQALSPELTEGALLEAGRLKAGEERLQMLASLVLMGINRVVVNDGDIKARLQFHAVAKEQTTAEMMMGQAAQGIAGRSQMEGGATTMVSTLKANAQAEASIKTDLMGEVRISFRSETFPLERFADSAAIQLLNRHAQWRTEAPAPAAPPAKPETAA